MSPAVKYTLGRLGLFVIVFVMLLPVPLNLLVRAMIALVASAVFSYFLLTKWRNEMAEQLGAVAERRQAEKKRLRAALAGDETAAAEGDRLAASPAAEDDRPTAPSAATKPKANSDRAAKSGNARGAVSAGGRGAVSGGGGSAMSGGDQAEGIDDAEAAGDSGAVADKNGSKAR